MQSALRWASLAVTAVVLYGLGVRGFHHRHFDLFLGAVLGLALLVVIVIVLTRSDGARPGGA